MSDSTWRRLRRVFRSSVEDEIDDEVAFHFQMRVDELVGRGLSRDDAERGARERFGDEASVRSTLTSIDAKMRSRRDALDRFDAARQDLTVSLRGLRREPLFAIGIVVTLGLGIGVNATMFGVIDRLMLRGPEGVADARRVERLYITANEGANGIKTRSILGYVSYATLRDRATSFAGLGAYSTGGSTVYGTGAQAREIPAARATWDLFKTLGAKPVVGRFYDATEDHPPRGENVVVLGYDFWQSEFGGDDRVLGRRITLGDTPYTIIGVAPRGFTGPERVRADVWFPMSLTAPTPHWAVTYNAQWLKVVARLKPDVDADRAGIEATTILRAAYTGDKPYMHQLVASVRPLWFDREGRPSQVVSISRWLMGVAIVVLLITCANVANLFIARTRRRRREIAVRLALGVGRAGLVRLLLIETLVVAGGGAVAGLGVAALGGKLMRATLLSSVAWSGSAIDGRVFAFTFVIAIGVGLIVGVAPALDATRLDLVRSLKTGDRDGGGRRKTLRATLSAAQAALSVVLLAGAALFVASLWRVKNVDLGFEPARVLRADPRFTPGLLAGPNARQIRAQGFDAALRLVQTLPWVEHAAIAAGSPYGNGFTVDVTIPGRDSLPSLPGGGPYVSAVSADYFATLGIALRRGRTFTPADHAGTTPIAIVAETMAAIVWPGQNPLGKCLIVGDRQNGQPTPPCAIVVGVVNDVHRESVREPATMQYYIPLGQEQGFGGSTLVVRPHGPIPEAMTALNRALTSMPQFSYATIETIQQSIDPEFRPWQLGAVMFGVFGLLALIIAAVGLYSVIAYVVSDRTRELGVRLALGATSGRVMRDVIVGGVATTTLGVLAGTIVALAAGRFIQPLLFNVSAWNPFVLGGVAAVVIGVALVAAWGPARRATRIDPVLALRAE
jgi:predicted permease